MIPSTLPLTDSDIKAFNKGIEKSNKMIDEQLAIFNQGFESQVNYNLIESSVKYIQHANETMERGYFKVR